MAQITIGGAPFNTIGELPDPGSKAPDFVLTKTDLTDISLNDLKGKKVVINIFPSIDTPVCSASVRRFNEEVSNLQGTSVVCVSLDLPFAHSRFCEAEGIKDVIPASEMRNRDFGDRYGVRMVDGPLAGLLARAVIVLNEESDILYSKLVSDISMEPEYDEVLNILKKYETEGGIDKELCTQAPTAEHSRPGNNDEP
ncbi:MAG: thiol peroxidase, partial [Desulfobacteraceae bacterium]|nr:thiol peroxidase [Desulfobacteraceae bacterium]